MVESKPKRKRKRRVKEPLTDELLAELLNSDDPRKFVSKNRITERNLPDYLQQLLEEKGLERASVVRDAGLNPTYGYEIFMGRKHASRNYLLQIAFALDATLQETNRILQAAGHNELYCKNRRDAIIIFCIDHGYPLMRTEDELYRFGEETIC
ncbi:MAG: XRE family transcriptional regulator [Eggerthellaceae bacterium]|nr:XRE family transcriptional regulator [Eggerthellaceae bacterium]